MVAPIKPRKVRALGKDSWWLVPAVADVTAPTILEINANTGINVSCTVLAEGDSLTKTTNKVTLPAYLCETEQYEGNDTSTFSMGDIMGGFDPQADASDDDKKAFEFLRDGFTGFAVRRQGVSALTGDATAGQVVDVVPVEIDAAFPTKSGTGNEAIYTFSAAVSVTGPVGLNVAATAT